MQIIHALREGAALPSLLKLYGPADGAAARAECAPSYHWSRTRRSLVAVAVAVGVISVLGSPVAWAAEPPFAPPETVTLTVSDPTGAPGDTVTITVGLTNVIGVDSLAVVKLCLAMDPTVLTPVAAARASQLAAVPDVGFNPTFGEGSVCLSAASPTPLAIAAGALFTVRAVVGPLVRTDDTTAIDIVDQPGSLVLLLRTVDEPGEGVKHVNDAGLFTASDGVTCTAGDVNGDGRVNAGDAVLALRIAVQLLSDPTIEVLCAADANLDRQVNSGDAVWILRRAVGLPKAQSATSSAAGASVSARLYSVPGGALLSLGDAAAVHGLDLDVAYDPRQLDVGLLAGADRSVTGGLFAEHDTPTGLRRVRWADALPLSSGGDGTLRLLLPAGARTGATPQLRVERLAAFDADGRPLPIEWLGEAAVEVVPAAQPGAPPGAGPRTRLLASAPNPFNPTTTVCFTVPRAGHVLLEVHDASGARVATLVDEARPAGQAQVRWSGIDGAGRPVASGVYFARMRMADASDVLRLVLVK